MRPNQIDLYLSYLTNIPFPVLQLSRYKAFLRNTRVGVPCGEIQLPICFEHLSSQNEVVVRVVKVGRWLCNMRKRGHCIFQLVCKQSNNEHFYLSPHENILSIAQIKTFIICFIQHLSKFNKIRTILPSFLICSVLNWRKL